MLDAKALPALNAAVSKLCTMLVAKRNQLDRMERSEGTGQGTPRQRLKLRKEIESLEIRLARAERLRDAALRTT